MMSRVKLLVLAAFLVLALSGVSQAAEVTARGYWWIEAISRQNWNFNAGQDDHFAVEQKLRTAFIFTANENLRGILDTQTGTNNWGNGLYAIGSGRTPASAGNAGADTAGNSNIMLRRGYIEYKWPNTLLNISVGFQTVTLPAAFGGGSAIFDDQVAAAVVSTPLTDNVSLLAGYARPYDSNAFGSTASVDGNGTATDVLFASVPVSLSGMNITPFAMYAYSGARTASATTGATSKAGFAGANSTNSDGLRGYWGGAAFTMTPSGLPLNIMADFNYGKATYTNYLNKTRDGGRTGWLADVAVDYTGLSMMTPEAFFTYSSGETGQNTNKSGRMPVIGVPQNWTIGSFFFGERLELTGSMNNPAGYTVNTLGYWAGGISLKDITFMDKLSHTVNILYAKGTNSVDYLKNTSNLNGVNYAGFLTDKDSLWEVDLNTRYKIYDELTGYVYLGYIKSNFDVDAWRGASNLSATTLGNLRGVSNSGDAYKIGVGLNYFF